jgi:hypothetical protein
MITNSFVNTDSPVYGKEANQKYIWTESEIALFEKINNIYDGMIVADLQTRDWPFQTYLKRKETVEYQSTIEGNMNWERMNNYLFIWRKISLSRPVQVGGYRKLETVLGDKTKSYLDSYFSNIYDAGEARAYLRISG